MGYAQGGLYFLRNNIPATLSLPHPVPSVKHILLPGEFASRVPRQESILSVFLVKY